MAQNFCRDCGLLLCNDCTLFNTLSQEHDNHFNRKNIISVEIYEKEREQLKKSYSQTLSDIKANLSSLRIANSADFKTANEKISNQCTKLVEIIENAKQETLYENEARYRASDDGHKALLADVEKA